MQRVIAVCLAPLLVLPAGCRTYYPIEVTTPIRALLNLSGYDRVLVAGFATNPGDPIDTNVEMVRLLRSQLRLKAGLTVANADVLSIEPENFQDVAYWRRIGEEYRRTLIVSGSVSFADRVETRLARTDRTAVPRRPRTIPGRENLDPVAAFDEQRHFTFRANFVFIDGETGATVYVRPVRLESRYDGSHNVPALSAYFELMDRLLPSFLSIVSDQMFHGTRTLLE